MKIPGIIGGLGPETTADFYLQIQDLAMKAGLKQRPFIIIASVAMPYDLENKIFLQNGDITETLPFLNAAITYLEKARTDFLVMPCNTLHILQKELVEKTSLPFISIVEETVKEIQKEGLKKVTMLSTGRLAESRLYHTVLENEGIEVLSPNEDEQKHVNEIISRLVNSQQTTDDKHFFNQYIDRQSKSSDAIVLACTDFHMLIESDQSIKIIDTLSILAKATFEKMTET